MAFGRRSVFGVTCRRGRRIRRPSGTGFLIVSARAVRLRCLGIPIPSCRGFSREPILRLELVEEITQVLDDANPRVDFGRRLRSDEDRGDAHRHGAVSVVERGIADVSGAIR